MSSAADAPPSPRYQALYKATVKEAASRGGPIMGRLVAVARQALQGRAAASKELRVRDALSEAAQSLLTHEADLSKRYPVALLAMFENPDSAKGVASAPAMVVQFDQLELMDEAQVQISVVMAKAQQGALLAAEASLAELKNGDQHEAMPTMRGSGRGCKSRLSELPDQPHKRTSTPIPRTFQTTLYLSAGNGHRVLPCRHIARLCVQCLEDDDRWGRVRLLPELFHRRPLSLAFAPR